MVEPDPPILPDPRGSGPEWVRPPPRLGEPALDLGFIPIETGVLAEVEAAALDASAIEKSFGESRVLRDVSVRVAPGEVHALLGENGAGKSTLIRIIAGALRPDAGTVKVGGRGRSVQRPTRRRAPRRRDAAPGARHRPGALCRRERDARARNPATLRLRQVGGAAPPRLGDLRSPRRGDRCSPRRRVTHPDRTDDDAARPRPVNRCSAASPRRADRLAHRCRTVEAVRGHPSWRRPRRRGALRLPSPRRGVRDRRHLHGPAQRRGGGVRSHLRHDRGRCRYGDDRPQHRLRLPRTPAAERRTDARGWRPRRSPNQATEPGRGPRRDRRRRRAGRIGAQRTAAYRRRRPVARARGA